MQLTVDYLKAHRTAPLGGDPQRDRSFEGHPYFEEQDPSYRTTKPDPGAAFMESVRASLSDLELQAG